MFRSFIKSCIRSVLPDSIYDDVVVIYWRWRLRVTGSYEPEVRILEHFVKPGDYVVDIGANMGQYASILSKFVGSEGRVVAIEALPSTYALGKRIVTASNVDWLNVALSDEENQVTLHLEMDKNGVVNTGRTSIAGKHETPEHSVTVRAGRLDVVLRHRQQRVTFIKCDVEGHEVEVVRGGMSVVGEDKPHLLIETNADNLPSLVAMLEPLGYSVFQLNGLGLRPLDVENTSGDQNFNCFFLRSLTNADTEVVPP